MESHISDLVCLASFTECVSSGLIQAVVRWCVTSFRADAVGRCVPVHPSVDVALCTFQLL